MRKIIDGKTYDTETASIVVSRKWTARWENDWWHRERAVYRTAKGALFGVRFDEWGRGGMATADRAGVWKHREDEIVPLMDATAGVSWCEEQGFDADTIEKAFPEAVEEA